MTYNGYMLKSLMDKENIYVLLQELGAHSIKPESNGLRSSCPIHQSSGGTVFTYNPQLHLYCCYGECKEHEKEGDFITMVMHCQKCSFDDACIFICEVCGIDIKLIEDNEEFMLEDLKNRIDSILLELDNEDESISVNSENPYGVKPIDTKVASKLIGLKDSEGYIDSLGFSNKTLELFNSGYDEKEKRWLLPIVSPEGDILGFDGRDITNKSKMKWKKRANLLKNLLLGRLDLVKNNIIEHDTIGLCEGKKDMMALYEAGFNFSTCTYGSSLSKEQYKIISTLVSYEIIVFPDGDAAGYKFVKSVLKYCYPEFLITVIEIPDEMDVADLSKKYLKELYEKRIPIEIWLNAYKYREKSKKL